MKRLLKLFKKKKTQSLLKNYKYVYICRTQVLNKKYLINILQNSNHRIAIKYNLKLKPIFDGFKGQGSVLCLCFNDYILFKTIFLKKFLDPILVKTSFIFSRNKLNKIFKLNSMLYLNLFIFNFIFFIIYNKMWNYFLLKNIIFYKYLSNIRYGWYSLTGKASNCDFEFLWVQFPLPAQ